MKTLISFLENEMLFSKIFLIFIGVIIFFLILRFIITRFNIQVRYLDTILFVISLLYLVFSISHVIVTKKYDGLWNIVFIMLVLFLLQILPKFVHWYDKKVDELSEKF